jgi:hypothetical protein
MCLRNKIVGSVCLLGLMPIWAQAQAPVQTQWEIKMMDMRIDKAFKRWANEAGYSFRWDADRYVMVGAHAVYTGSIEQAIEGVLSTPGIRDSQYPLEACLYQNTPPLIRVTRLGDQAEGCK